MTRLRMPWSKGSKAPDVRGLDRVSERVIYPHVFENADREVGGVLVGRLPSKGGAPNVTGAIPAIHADEQRATLTFTQDAWEHVHNKLDNEYPEGTQIIGWYHSHPGFGIFLSEHDLFIHRNFFSGASQIAQVVDPLNCSEGVFVWHEQEIVPFYERPTPEKWEPPAFDPRRHRSTTERAVVEMPAGEADRGAYPIVPLVVAAILGLVIGLGAWNLLPGNDDAPRPTQTTSTSSSKATPTVAKDDVHSPPPTNTRSGPQVVEPVAGQSGSVQPTVDEGGDPPVVGQEEPPSGVLPPETDPSGTD